MDQWKPAEVFFEGMQTEGDSANGFGLEADPNALSARLVVSFPESSQKVEPEAKGSSNARKSHKADREKLRRDRLNEQFLDLGNAIDPDRPRNDKATILADAIQMLKDLTGQVHKLKAEHASLSDESRELTREKNELREEKGTLKSEIDNLNVQYQQRVGCLYPWTAVDPSVIMGPPSPYPYPIPVPIPSGPVPFHSPIPLYPFFQNQSPVSIPSHCASHHPYSSNNPYAEQQSAQHLPSRPLPHPSSGDNHTMCQHESQSRSADQRCGDPERSGTDFSDVVTELELKMPGSATPLSTSKPAVNEQNSSSEGRKGRRSRQIPRKGGENSDGSCSSGCSSPPGLPSISSNSNGGGGSVADS